MLSDLTLDYVELLTAQRVDVQSDDSAFGQLSDELRDGSSVELRGASYDGPGRAICGVGAAIDDLVVIGIGQDGLLHLKHRTSVGLHTRTTAHRRARDASEAGGHRVVLALEVWQGRRQDAELCSAGGVDCALVCGSASVAGAFVTPRRTRSCAYQWYCQGQEACSKESCCSEGLGKLGTAGHFSQQSDVQKEQTSLC